MAPKMAIWSARLYIDSKSVQHIKISLPKVHGRLGSKLFSAEFGINILLS